MTDRAFARHRRPRAGSLRDVRARLSEREEGIRHDVFISFSGPEDRILARRLSRALRAVTSPWYRKSPLRVFVDEEVLPTGTELTAGLEERLDASARLVLIASRESARAPYVRDEVRHWRDTRSEAVLLAHSAGTLTWPHGATDFDWTRTDALNEDLFSGAYSDIPLWADLTPVHGRRWRGARRLRRESAKLAAGILRMEPELLTRAESRRYLIRRLTAGAVASGIFAGSLAGLSYKRQEVQQAHARIEQQVIDQAKSARAIDPQLSLRLDIAAVVIHAPGARDDLMANLTSTHFDGVRATQGAAMLRVAARSPLAASVSPTNGTVTLWNTNSRPFTRLSGLPATAGVSQLSFSPDGQTLATIAKSGLILWDVANPRAPAPRKPLSVDGISVSALGVAFSPDGTRLAVSEEDNQIGGRYMDIWDVRNRDSPRRLGSTGYSNGFIDQISYSGDGHFLATSGGDEQDPPADTLFDVRDPSRPREAGSVGTSAVMAVAAPSGPLVAVADASGQTSLWDATDLDSPRQLLILPNHSAAVTAIAFGVDDQTDTQVMATGEQDGTTNLYDVSTATRPTKLDSFAEGPEGVTALAFAKDGRTLTVATKRALVQWATERPAAPAPLPALPGSTSMRVAISPGRRYLVGTSNIGTLWTLDSTGRATVTMKLPLDLDTDGIVFSPDARTLILALWPKDMAVYGMGAAGPSRLNTLPDDSFVDPQASAFSSDGRLLAVPDREHHVIVWDLQDPASPRKLVDLGGQRSYVTMLQFSTDSSALTAVGGDGTVTRWSLASDELSNGPYKIAHLLPSPGLDPNGNVVRYGSVIAFGLPGDRFLTQQQGIDEVWGWSPDGRPEVLASTRTEPLVPDPTVADGDSGIEGVSADGTLALARSTLNQISLWDISDLTDPVLLGAFQGNPQDNLVNGIALADDGSLAAVTTQSDILLHDLRPLSRIAHNPTGVACGIAGGGLTRDQWNRYVPGFPYRPTCDGP